ncbi:CRISPR-associated Cas5 family Ecoli subtype protein [Escherichia coli]|uniref:type I-E CRISPR-associated protein Cas5/CasD n=1 Tax=Escherichia coli TaxID=562 RepID=UPI000DA5DA05|nr:type I-E CRISPR-associated protein Cas5/CasD [Escherichia coli]SQQ62349.1 CRISPR-associated Cas5 family Ecoli subtype protein [Escherichia coli]
MRSYLILRLAGPMQAWGQPTFEGTRPTGRFPTRSGLLGLLGACLGIQRDDTSSLQALSESVQFAVRCDELILDDRRVDAPRDKCTLSCAINGIHAAFHYLKKNYISGCVMTVPTGW